MMRKMTKLFSRSGPPVSLWHITCENKTLGTRKFLLRGRTKGEVKEALKMASMVHKVDLRGIVVTPGDLNSKTGGFTVQDIVKIKCMGEPGN